MLRAVLCVTFLTARHHCGRSQRRGDHGAALVLRGPQEGRGESPTATVGHNLSTFMPCSLRPQVNELRALLSNPDVQRDPARKRDVWMGQVSQQCLKVLPGQEYLLISAVNNDADSRTEKP